MTVAERLHESRARGRRVRVLANRLNRLLPEAISVLDVGSGDGRIARAVADMRPDLDVHGVDVLVRSDTAIPVDHFDGRTLPFGDREFGAAVLVDVLHHCEEPSALLAEAARVAPLVVVKDHIADNRFDVMVLRFMDRVGNARFSVSLPYRYWSTRQWKEAFSSLGLAVEAWESHLGLYPPPASWLFERDLHFVARLRG